MPALTNFAPPLPAGVRSGLVAGITQAITPTGFAYLTLLERGVIARFQSRVGPNRAGPYGLLQPLADGVKLIFKEEVIPAEADKWTFIIAPLLAVIPAIVVFAVIPMGGVASFFGVPVNLTLAANLNVGVLYVLDEPSIGLHPLAT